MTEHNLERLPIRRALISVFDKTGLAELAQGLHRAGVSLVSTGSTAETIRQEGLPVTEVAELTGFPECLEGRVKTLHPRVHAGILADRTKEEHRKTLADLKIDPFDLVVVNLYPFSQTVASGASQDEIIEKIDIGGPSMVRAAAKNHRSLSVVVDPARYDRVLQAVQEGGFSLAERQELAAAAFAHTAAYDAAVATWTAQHLLASPAEGRTWPAYWGKGFNLSHQLRYGENPHQGGALYLDPAAAAGIAQARQLGGKEMSYNNYVDGDAALRAAYDFVEPAVAIIKHNNPCGIAIASPQEQDPLALAYAKAQACDPVSAYGGVVAANRPVTAAMASKVAQIFTEVIIAPAYEPQALEILKAKKNLRILELPEDFSQEEIECRLISGGALLQEADRIAGPGDRVENWQLVAGQAADQQTLDDLYFAWRALRSTKSNAILLAGGGAALGIGMGQVNRVDSCKLAVERANSLADTERARGAVAASDAFFPFADGLEVLIKAGVKAVVQPGGSIRDDQVIAAAEQAGISMYLTGTRHFFH